MFKYSDLKKIHEGDSPDFVYHWIGNTWYYVDQLSEDFNYFFRAYAQEYLSEHYGITTEQYYNLIINKDINYEGNRCPYCNRIKKFEGLQLGYDKSKTCLSTECVSKIYSESSHYHRTLAAKQGKLWFQSEEGRKRVSETTTRRNIEWGKKGIAVFSDLATNRYVQKCNFLSKGYDEDPAVLYWARTSTLGQFKIGVTTNLEVRLASSQGRLRYIYPILESTRLEVAELEFLVKEHFNTASEYFDCNKFKEVLLIINKLLA